MYIFCWNMDPEYGFWNSATASYRNSFCVMRLVLHPKQGYRRLKPPFFPCNLHTNDFCIFRVCYRDAVEFCARPKKFCLHAIPAIFQQSSQFNIAKQIPFGSHALSGRIENEQQSHLLGKSSALRSHCEIHAPGLLPTHTSCNKFAFFDFPFSSRLCWRRLSRFSTPHCQPHTHRRRGACCLLHKIVCGEPVTHAYKQKHPVVDAHSPTPADTPSLTRTFVPISS